MPEGHTLFALARDLHEEDLRVQLQGARDRVEHREARRALNRVLARRELDALQREDGASLAIDGDRDGAAIRGG